MTSEKDFYGELAKFDPSPDLVDEATDMEEDDEHVLLICGDCPQARALADLADKCGFVVDVAVQTALEAEAGNFSKARKVQALPGFDNLIQACGIGRSHYVCIFAPDEESCLNALYESGQVPRNAAIFLPNSRKWACRMRNWRRFAAR